MKILSSEKGSVLFFILIAVVLFAALSYAVSNMMRSGMSGGSTSISEERAQIYAGEILDYGRTVRQAVQSLRISNGCRDTEISFENNIVAGYTNGTNTDCQIFHGDGANIPWVSPAEDINDGSEWIFNGSNIVDEIGTTLPDLILMLPNISTAICTEINTASGVSSIGTDATINFTQFTGSYVTAATVNFADGNSFGCLNFDNGGTDELFFYQVLIAR